MAFIHVIIPVYNAERYLRETVASVLSQPTTDIDIVLVNDGSSDGSAAICDELAAQEKRIHVIHQKNAGVSAARNAGIEAVLQAGTTDGYIAFLDSDDFWCPNVFSEERISEMKKDAPDVHGFSTLYVNAEGSRCRILSPYTSQKLVFPKKYQMQVLWTQGHFSAHLYHVRLFRENPIRFDVKCRQNEDVIFAAKILFCSRTIFLTDVFLYCYRKNRQSVTSTAKYRPENALEIPNAWYSAADFADLCAEIPEQMHDRWVSFCRTTSSIRCIEMIRELAFGGYSYKTILRSFENQPYFASICNLQPEDCAPWQRSDLERIKADMPGFCRQSRRNGMVKVPLRRLLAALGLLDYLERKQFPLFLKDIIK